MKVEDKRFWARGDADDDAPDDAEAATTPSPPGIDPAELDALRRRAEGAERKLVDVQATFVAAKAELDRTRERLERDLERKVELRFGNLLADLVETVDDLDRALEHGAAIPAAAPVVVGIALARDRFLAALAKAGVERFDPAGTPFDPNVAEAVGVVPVSDPARHDVVVEVNRPGYSLGERVIRPARVLVGRLLQ